MSNNTEDFDFREAFLKANANFDYISYQFAQVIRHLMRAVSSDHPGDNAVRAAEVMDMVAELLSRTKEKFDFYMLFAKALEEFEENAEWGTREHLIVRAAQRGVKLLVERSCSDNGARGRASKRESEFLSAIAAIEEHRRERRADLSRPGSKL